MENLEIALLKYNKKTWFKSALLGLIIGIAVIVPGISGSTVAIIFKLYDQFLYAIGNLFKQFRIPAPHRAWRCCGVLARFYHRATAFKNQSFCDRVPLCRLDVRGVPCRFGRSERREKNAASDRLVFAWRSDPRCHGLSFRPVYDGGGGWRCG